jgi:hypothetical protein
LFLLQLLQLFRDVERDVGAVVVSVECGSVLDPELVCRVCRHVFIPPLHELVLERRPLVESDVLTPPLIQSPGSFHPFTDQIFAEEHLLYVFRKKTCVPLFQSTVLDRGLYLCLRRFDLGYGYPGVHHDVPRLTRSAASDSKGAVAQVKANPTLDVLRSIRRSPIRKADRDVVEEASAVVHDRLHRSTHGGDHVEVESGYHSVFFLTVS